MAMPERRRQFTVVVSKAPGMNIYEVGKSLGMQNWRSHDQACHRAHNPCRPGVPAGAHLGQNTWQLAARQKRSAAALPDVLYVRVKPLAAVIYAWLNDEDTLRKEGSRTDVYDVFKRMLERGDVPSTINELIQASADTQP
jgi:hypothetical protein